MNTDKKQLYKVNLKTGRTKLLYSNPDYDVMFAAIDNINGETVAVKLAKSVYTYEFIDPIFKTLPDMIPEFEQYCFEVLCFNRRKKTLLFSLNRGDMAPTIYFADMNTRKVEKVASKFPELDNVKLLPTKAVKFQARDGMVIHAYLTKPALNLRATELPPLVIKVHGGPTARSYSEYSWQTQFFANRGYAVLDVDYRGSYGYGLNYFERALGEWDRAVCDDLLDAKKWAVINQICDSKKVAIFGSSFGGYLVMESMTRSPDAFKCGISFAGISDFSTYDYNHVFTERFFDWLFGSRKNWKKEASPISKAGKLKNPVLLLHGVKDQNCHAFQSADFKIANSTNPKVQVLYDVSAGHNFHGNLAEEFIEKMEIFLAKHLGGRCELSQTVRWKVFDPH